jgi:hypothetical protein
MKACKIIEVINGRMKGVIDPRHSLTGQDMEDLIRSGVDDITVRRPPVPLEWIHKIRIDDAETFLRLAGWVKWDVDPYVWLRPGKENINRGKKS